MLTGIREISESIIADNAYTFLGSSPVTTQIENGRNATLPDERSPPLITLPWGIGSCTST